MKKGLLFVFLSVFWNFKAQNQVAKDIQKLEKAQTVFKSLAVLNTTNAQFHTTIGKIVDNATVTQINPLIVNDIVANKYQNIVITVPYEGNLIAVKLFRASLFSEGFHLDSDKQKNINYSPGVYYRGIVDGDYTSVVSFNFFENDLNGIIATKAWSNIVIGKMNKTENTSDYLIYQDANLKVRNDFSCGVKDSFSANNQASAQRNPTTSRCVTLYFEVDYDLYLANGSTIATTTNWMTSVFNNVQTIYANDGITTALQSMFIWTTQDPYNGAGNNSTAYLLAFNSYRPVFDGDLGQLVGIDPGGLGGVAITIDGLCSQDNFSYSDVFFDYQTVPTYSWTVEVITHELGHLMGSPHTHGCYWNGDNTAIDGCGQQAGYHEGSCANGPIPSATEKGTIMSYCHLISGVGINLSNGFGPQPSQRIISRVNNGTCLSADCINTCINTVATIQLINLTATSATVSWVETGSATSWDVVVYPFGGTPNTWTTVTTNTYSVTNLLPNTYYVVRVRPNCSAGLIASYRQLLLVTATNFCSGIVFTDSGGENGNYTNMETVIRTIIPDVPNNAIRISFTAFSLELNYDYLYIYDGNSTAAPLLNTGGSTGTAAPGPYTSSATDGSLTVKFFSDQGVVDSGFVATISCIPNLNTTTHGQYLDFSYYPNPTRGAIVISAKTPINHVFVYDVMGQLLYEGKINDLTTAVDMTAFASGTYFFKLQFEGDREANLKVMKN